MGQSLPKEMRFWERHEKYYETRVLEEIVATETIMTPLITNFSLKPFYNTTTETCRSFSMACGVLSITCGIYALDKVLEIYLKWLSRPPPHAPLPAIEQDLDEGFRPRSQQKFQLSHLHISDENQKPKECLDDPHMHLLDEDQKLNDCLDYNSYVGTPPSVPEAPLQHVAETNPCHEGSSSNMTSKNSPNYAQLRELRLQAYERLTKEIEKEYEGLTQEECIQHILDFYGDEEEEEDEGWSISDEDMAEEREDVGV